MKRMVQRRRETQKNERRRLLYDLRRSHAQHMALFMALRENRFGTLSRLGQKEAARLATNGKGLLDALDRLLSEGDSQELD